MPKYTLPPEKRKGSKHKGDVPTESVGDYARMVILPVNTEILDALSVGDTVEVTLQGEVVETSKRDSPDEKRRSIMVKVASVSAYPENEEKASKSFKKGFKRVNAY